MFLTTPYFGLSHFTWQRVLAFHIADTLGVVLVITISTRQSGKWRIRIIMKFWLQWSMISNDNDRLLMDVDHDFNLNFSFQLIFKQKNKQIFMLRNFWLDCWLINYHWTVSVLPVFGLVTQKDSAPSKHVSVLFLCDSRTKNISSTQKDTPIHSNVIYFWSFFGILCAVLLSFMISE